MKGTAGSLYTVAAIVFAVLAAVGVISVPGIVVALVLAPVVLAIVVFVIVFAAVVAGITSYTATAVTQQSARLR